MVQLGDVIEIESSDSSPELTPHPTRYKSRDKGKGKATPYRPGFASSVIEITDSESEADNVHASPCRRVGPSHSNSHTGPGPSSPKRIFISNSYPVRPTGSLDNIITPFQQNDALASGSGSGAGSASGSATGVDPTKQNPSGHNHNPPLFLSSDDEHKSPAPVTDTTHIGRVEVNVTSTSVIEREPTTTIPETQSQTPTRPTEPDSDPILFENVDPTSTSVAQILEIIPNVEPTHLLQLIETHLPAYSVNRNRGADGGEGAGEATVEEQAQGVVGHVLHLLFENPDYPKADLRGGGKRKGKDVGDPDTEDDLEGKGKGKGKAKDPALKKPKIDYASIDRPFPGGPNYFDLALVRPFLHQPTTLSLILNLPVSSPSVFPAYP